MTKRWKQYLFRCVLLCISLGFAILASEIALQITHKPLVPDNLYCQHDAKLGWAKIPSRTNHFKTITYNASETINSYGFRGREHTIHKPSHTQRVVILGDSFAESYTVNKQALFSNLLENRLSKISPTEVINTGIGGYSTDQELIVFEDTAKKFSPDITVLMFCENDVILNITGEALYGYTKPYYQLIDNELTLTNVPVPLSGPTSSKGIKNLLQRHSILYRKTRTAIERTPAINQIMMAIGAKHAYASSSFKQFTNNDESIEILPDIFRGWKNKLDDDYIEAWAITELLLKALKQKTSAVQSQLIVFYITLEQGANKQAWENTKHRYHLNDQDWHINNSAKTLSKICHKLSIAFIDPTTQFIKAETEAKTKNKSMYYPNDGHWTPEGNQLVCDILATYIENNVSQHTMTQY